MIWARVDVGVVVETWPTPPVLHPDLAVDVYEAPDEVREWWRFDGSTFMPPLSPAADPTLYRSAGTARRARQFRAALDRNPLDALVQRAQEDQA